MFKSTLKRFLKGFVAGGMGSVFIMLKEGTTLTSFNDLKTWGFALGVAFLTGGFLAIEKAYNWTPEYKL